MFKINNMYIQHIGFILKLYNCNFLCNNNISLVSIELIFFCGILINYNYQLSVKKFSYLS